MTNTLILIKPLISRVGMPTPETIKSLTNNNIRIIILDLELNRVLAESSYENERFKGYKYANKLKSEFNPHILTISERASYWNWKVGDGIAGKDDIRNSESKIVYVDCTLNDPGSLQIDSFSPEMFVMSLVEDFKTENRGYYRIGKDQINDLLKLYNNNQNLYNTFGGGKLTNSSRLVDIKVLINALIFWLDNGFHHDETDVLLYSLETDIYNKPGNQNWCLNMATPVLKGFITYYGILPEVPEGDKQAMISTGITPTTSMANNGQYRRIVTKSVCKVMANFVVNNDMHKGFENGKSLDWYSVDLWRNVVNSL